MATPLPARGRQTARGVLGGQNDLARRSKGRHLLPVGQMKRDVATIVDVGFCRCVPLHHRGKDFICNSASHGSHWRDENTAMWGNRTQHPACNGVLKGSVRCRFA